MSDVLARFGPATQDWFRGAFPRPTDAQIGAWNAISHGKHALVVAPTGSGKTLSAFLWAIDRVFHEKDAAPPQAAGRRRRTDAAASPTRILYISPLKALGVDVERNLRSPLVGIGQSARRLGISVPEVTVGVRSGDTTSSDRRKLVTAPPDILITTPESLYLMLTSQAGQTLAGVHTVIVDEVHAVAATKRGAHLAVSLERLDALRESLNPGGAPAQRIGLSATVRPIDEVARFLGGSAPVEIVAPRSTKAFDMRVIVPVDDMMNPPPPPGSYGVEPSAEEVPADEDWFADPSTGSGTGTARGPRRPEATEMTGSVWPHVEEAIVDRIVKHRSTIVFCNSRRLAERLTARLNEIYSERMGLDLPDPTGSDRARGDDGAGRGHGGRCPRAREGAPRVGLEGAARAGRGGAEVRHPALRRRDEQSRTRHRHGRRRPRHPGGGAAERGVGPAADRAGGPPGRRGEPGGAVPEASQRRAAHRDRHRADARRPDRIHHGAAEPARHPRAADGRRVRGRADRRRRLVRDPQAQCALPRAAPVGVRGDARPARGAVPLRRVRRAATAGHLGPRSRHPHRAAGGAAHRGDQRRDDPRPRTVRRLRRRRDRERPRRRARRGDGLRVARQRRLHPRHDELADRGDHPRSGQCRAGIRAARKGAVLARRRPRPARRAGRGARRVLAGGLDRDSREGRGAPARRGARRQRRRATSSPTSPSSARPPARSPPTARSRSSAAATRSATGASSCIPRTA